MVKTMDDENDNLNKDDDWGNPPTPLTPENRKKALRAQLIIGLISIIGIALPALFWALLK